MNKTGVSKIKHYKLRVDRRIILGPMAQIYLEHLKIQVEYVKRVCHTIKSIDTSEEIKKKVRITCQHIKEKCQQSLIIITSIIIKHIYLDLWLTDMICIVMTWYGFKNRSYYIQSKEKEVGKLISVRFRRLYSNLIQILSLHYCNLNISY